MASQFFGIKDYRARVYFERLEKFLGTEEINNKIARINRIVSSNKGLYLDKWVLPKTAWWRGFGEARQVISTNGSFRREVTKTMEYPLQTAYKLSVLHKTLTDERRKDIKGRLLGDESIEPTLFEIEASAHFLAMGYQIEWFATRSDSGERTPEFTAISGNSRIEVECKSKHADSGRRIDGKTFLRLADKLLDVARMNRVKGQIVLTVASRLPKNDKWFNEAISQAKVYFVPGRGSCRISTNEGFELNLQHTDKSAIKKTELLSSIDYKERPYSHYAFMGDEFGDLIVDPIVFRLDSIKPDQFVDDVLESLRNAIGQFSRKAAGVISCLIPEIESFDGLQQDSAIQRMTASFFEKYASESIYAVTYVSNIVRKVKGNVIYSDMPSLTFYNHRYNKIFGTKFPIYGERVSKALS